MHTEKQWRKFNKQSCFFEKIDEIDKSLDRLTNLLIDWQRRNQEDTNYRITISETKEYYY